MCAYRSHPKDRAGLPTLSHGRGALVYDPGLTFGLVKPALMRIRVLFALTAALLSCGLASCGSSSNTSTKSTTGAKIVTIGVDLPLSGADASVGESTLNGVKLAVEQANKASVPGGYTFVVSAVDDAIQGVHSPEQGAANMRTFVADPTVLAVIGPYNSNVAQAQIPISNAAPLLQIGPSVVSDGLTMGAPALALRRTNPTTISFFRVCTTDSHQGSAAAAFAKKLGWNRAYVIDDNETYGLDLANVFERDFTNDGGTILGHDHLAKNEQDFSALLTKIAAAKPQVIFFGGVTSTGGGLIKQQMARAGLANIPFLGGDGLPDIATAIGTAADGTYYTIAAPNVEKLPSAQTFVAQYQARFHTPVGAYSANAYAAARVAIVAIEQAMSSNNSVFPTRTQVISEAAKTKALATPIGPISFDANGDVKNPVVSLYEIQHGHATFLDQQTF